MSLQPPERRLVTEASLQNHLIRTISGTVTLTSGDPRVVEVYTTGTATINGVTLPADTAAVFSRTAAGQWRYMVVGGGQASWVDVPGDGTLEVTPNAPVWVDDPVEGGGSWTASQDGVAYSPATGTAEPGEAVTVTANPTTGYYFPFGATTSWTHTFPAALAASVADDFTGTDNTNLAGRVTPTGSLTWAADSTTSPISGVVSTGPAKLRNNTYGRIAGDPVSALQLTLASGNHEVGVDYSVGLGRIYLGIMGTLDGQRITCFLDNAQGIKMYRWTAGGTTSSTQLGATITDAPATGRIALGYDGTNAYVKIDGSKVLDVATSPTGLGGRCAIGLGAGSGAYHLDNFEAKYLP